MADRNAFTDKGLCTEKTSGLWSTTLTFCSGLFMCSIHPFSSSLAAEWPISMAFDSVPLLMPLAWRTHLINFGGVLDHGCLAWNPCQLWIFCCPENGVFNFFGIGSSAFHCLRCILMLTPVGVVVRFFHLFSGTALWGILLVLVEAFLD